MLKYIFFITVLGVLGVVTACSNVTKTQAAVNSPKVKKCECIFCDDIRVRAGRGDRAYKPDIPESSILVSSDETLKSALLNASRGDVIIVAPGRYNIGHVKIKQPVQLISEALWGATFVRGSLLELQGRGSRVQGFQFLDGTTPTPIEAYDTSIIVQSADVEITDNRFFNVGTYADSRGGIGEAVLIFNKNDVSITFNVFEKIQGIAIGVGDSSKRPIIRNNDFINSPYYGGSGEIVHLGDAYTTPVIGLAPVNDLMFAEITNNFVSSWQLESELISIKSDKNLIAENYVENSSSAAFVVRMGNDNIIRDNVMRGNLSFPLRISGGRNVVENNYFEGQGAMAFLHSEVVFTKIEPRLHYAYWPARDNIIRNNTFSGYTRALGVVNEPYIVKSAPEGNLFSGNTVYTNAQQAFEKDFGDIRSSRFEDMRIRDVSSETCEPH